MLGEAVDMGQKSCPHRVDMWSLGLKRPPYFIIPINIRSTSRTLSPKRNGRLQHQRVTADWVTPLLTPAGQQSRGISMRREARLRPEYAQLYPMLEPGKWESALVTAQKVAAIRLLQLADTFVLHDRVLADTHFEFRGGSARRDGSALVRGDVASVASPLRPQNPAVEGKAVSSHGERF
jgi:hypothetical protein